MTREEEFANALNAYRNLDVHINKTLRLVGIDAIKKQIPMKPKENIVGFYCANCNRYVESVYSFCGFCGQKIYWEGVSDE